MLVLHLTNGYSEVYNKSDGLFLARWYKRFNLLKSIERVRK